MLKPKIGVCIDCSPGSPPKPLIAGRCQQHYWIFRSRKSNLRTRLLPSKTPICLEFASTKTQREWYLHHIDTCSWECENCQTPIKPINEKQMFSAQAHILPKLQFPTLKNLIDNHLTLGFSECGCHQLWDLSWEKAAGMSIFTVARDKILPLIPLLSPVERRKLPQIFITITQENE